MRRVKAYGLSQLPQGHDVPLEEALLAVRALLLLRVQQQVVRWPQGEAARYCAVSVARAACSAY